MFYVYILKSLRTDKTYVGSTNKNVIDRLKEHNQGSNQWTKQNKPFKLIYYESLVCKTCALHREKFLKSGVGNKIVQLIVGKFGV